MAQTRPSQDDTSNSSSSKKPRLDKAYDLLTCTIKQPEFAYAHMELVTDGGGTTEGSNQASQMSLDELQVKSYCTAALRQFLGLTGAAIPFDILKAEGTECWVRMQSDDLGSFTAAITAWKGTTDNGVNCLLRVKQASNWLGTMLGRNGQDRIWNS